jgi:hypothetical protein
MNWIVEIWAGFLWPLQSIYTNLVSILHDVDALLFSLFDIIVRILHIGVESAILIIGIGIALFLVIAVRQIAGYAAKFARPHNMGPGQGFFFVLQRDFAWQARSGLEFSR